jgi:hypothetical protein
MDEVNSIGKTGTTTWQAFALPVVAQTAIVQPRQSHIQYPS